MIDVIPTEEGHAPYGLGTTYVDGLGYGHNGAHAGYLTVMGYDIENDIAIVLFMSLFNFDDLGGEINFMYNIGRTAKQILGFE
jgi:D-alanyl-D-alanine carboxypeptidase